MPYWSSSLAPSIRAKVPLLSAHQRKSVKNAMKAKMSIAIPMAYPRLSFPYSKSKSLLKTKLSPIKITAASVSLK